MPVTPYIMQPLNAWERKYGGFEKLSPADRQLSDAMLLGPRSLPTYLKDSPLSEDGTLEAQPFGRMLYPKSKVTELYKKGGQAYEWAKEALAKGANPNVTLFPGKYVPPEHTPGDTLLHFCATNDLPDMVELLLQQPKTNIYRENQKQIKVGPDPESALVKSVIFRSFDSFRQILARYPSLEEAIEMAKKRANPLPNPKDDPLYKQVVKDLTDVLQVISAYDQYDFDRFQQSGTPLELLHLVAEKGGDFTSWKHNWLTPYHSSTNNAADAVAQIYLGLQLAVGDVVKLENETPETPIRPSDKERIPGHFAFLAKDLHERVHTGMSGNPNIRNTVVLPQCILDNMHIFEAMHRCAVLKDQTALIETAKMIPRDLPEQYFQSNPQFIRR